jgi:hypothetical protein
LSPSGRALQSATINYPNREMAVESLCRATDLQPDLFDPR